MTQPELGKKLAEIRKQKGVTQEELVEKCNVTVRTIQRIEAGEVTPRPSTLKLIFEALEYDFHSIVQEESARPSSGNNNFKNLMRRIYFLNSSDYNDFGLISGELQLAWIAGIVYFILGFPEAFLEYGLFKSELLFVGKTGFVIIKLLVICSFILFIRGFIILGNRHKNRLLVFSSYLYLLILIVDSSFDILSLPFDFEGLEEFQIRKPIMYGTSSLLFGIGLIGMKNISGRSARYAGVLEMIIGVSFLSVIFFLAGIVLSVPAEILEIYMLFKYWENIENRVSGPSL